MATFLYVNNIGNSKLNLNLVESNNIYNEYEYRSTSFMVNLDTGEVIKSVVKTEVGKIIDDNLLEIYRKYFGSYKHKSHFDDSLFEL